MASAVAPMTIAYPSCADLATAFVPTKRPLFRAGRND
jgi:hypothetical protein